MPACCLKNSQKMLKWIGGLLSVIVVIGVVTLLLTYSSLHRPLPKNVNGTLPNIIITVEKNSTATAFVRDLHHLYLVRSPRLFLIYLRLFGYAHQLKAGVYEIKAGESILPLLNRVVTGDVLRLPFRVIEGSTQKTIQKQLSDAPYLSQQLNGWQSVAQGHPSAEGLLLADTYYYDAGTDSNRLLMTAHQSLMKYLNTAFQRRDSDLPYQTPYELLIAASIIEKEASKPQEKRLISGVLVNRLHQHMPLQMDPTVIYALGEQFQGRLTHADLSVNSPYNTYLHHGLPPTPIAMVGRDAIEAAAHPAASQYLYYVASGDGCHHFSKTYTEQRKAISASKSTCTPD
jgi:UPF0755 protein